MSAAGIFAKVEGKWIIYDVEIQVHDRLIGGIPKDPDTIRKWLTARLEVDDRAIIELADEIAAQMAGDEGERPSADDLMTEVARQFEGGNGFKSVDGQLVYEGRCMKAALKEAMNVAYPGTKFPGKSALGVTEKGADVVKKGLLRVGAERIFVEPLYIPLGVSEPSGTEQRIKHIVTPQGPRSAINVVDYVEKPKLTFTVQVLDDFLPQDAWGRIWMLLEQIGIGADRARSDGKFELLRWERAPG